MPPPFGNWASGFGLEIIWFWAKNGTKFEWRPFCEKWDEIWVKTFFFFLLFTWFWAKNGTKFEYDNIKFWSMFLSNFLKFLPPLFKILRTLLALSHFSHWWHFNTWIKALFLRRPWSNDLGSTRTLATLLRPWIRRITMIISAWWLRTNSKFSGQEFKKSLGTLDHRKLLSRCGLLQSRSSSGNEKCADRSTSLRLTLSGERNFFFYHGFADLLRHILCPNLEFRTPLSILTWSALFTGNLVRWYWAKLG